MERNTVENIILMINILQSRECVNGNELAERLNVSKRTIQKYKSDLEKMNIQVQTRKGKYGGYYLDRSILDFNIPINQEEYSALQIAKELLKQDARYLFQKEMNHAIEKIEIGMQKNSSDMLTSDTLLYDSKPNVYTEFERYKYEKIGNAINKVNKLSVEYLSLQSGKTSRIIHPYTLFACNGFPYVVAYCELRKEVRTFRISRISSVKQIREHYTVPDDLRIKDNMSKGSLESAKEEIRVKLMVRQPMAQIVMERIWSEDQEISLCHERNSILFEANLPQSEETISWILSLGQYAEVLEPETLKETIKSELKEMLGKYSQT